MRNAVILAVLVSVVLAVACPPQVLAQIEATMEDTLQEDQDNDTQADPGDTLRYTITIIHTGEPEDPAGTNIQVTVPLDPNTTLVPGMVRTTPVGVADRYDTVINVGLTVTVNDPTTEGVLANDINLDGDTLTVVDAGTPQTTTLGGTVVFTADGGLTYTPPPEATGVDTFTYTVTDPDGNDPTPTTVTVGLNVNVAPSFVAGPDQTVREDAGRQTVPTWATALSTGPPYEVEQTLRAFLISTDNDALFTVLPAISITGTTGALTYTPAPDANGTATVTVRLRDDGSTAGGGENTSAPQTFTITVTAVNDPPAFTAGPAQTVLEDAGAQTVRAWATGITAGPANEAGQTLTFRVNTDLATLFAVLPAIDPGTGDLTYTPAPDANGTATVTVRLRDNGGTADEGVDTSVPQTFTVTVTAVNDAPSFVAGPAQTVPEDAGPQTVTGWATALSPGPADEAGQALTVFLVSTDNDALFVALPAISPTTGTLTYTLTANAHGVAHVTVRLQDDGGTANGGVDISAPQTFAITVTAVNDAPVNTVPEAQTTVEDTPLLFSTATANLISISDADGAPGPLVVTLSVTQGTLTLDGTQDLTFTEGDGTADATMTFSGTLTAINTALDGLVFTPALHFNGVSTLQLTTTDPDAPGGALSDTDRVLITVTAVNDAPEHTVPGPQTTLEDVALVFNAAEGNALSVRDVDAGEGSLEVTLSVTQGRLTLRDTTDLSFTEGNGRNDATMTFTGTLAAINAALEGLVFTPPRNFAGESTLHIVTNDQGNTGDGGPQSDTDAVTITISAVNDTPVNTVPGPQETGEDQALVLSAETGNALSITDVDAGDGFLEVTLRVTRGLLALSGTAGLTFITGDGTNDATMTFTGTLAAINTALDGLRFIPPNGFVGESRLRMSTSDQGNTGSGGAQSDTDTVVITVVAVNDAPVNTVPGPQMTAQDMALVFSTAHGNALRISDVDAGGGFLEVTLSVTAGALTLSRTTGLTFTVGDGSADATMTFSGTLANINTALEGLVFTPPNGFRGDVTLQLMTNDQGNTGAGGPQSDTDTVLIAVGTRNDPPVNTVPEPQTIPEDAVLVFTTDNGNRISISDPDISTGALAVTLSVTVGTLTLGNTTGLTFTEGDGTADAAMRFTGVLAAINTALDGLVFTPPPDFAGDSTFQITSDDQGNTGSGGPQTDTDTVLITVTAVNDAPVNRVPDAQTTPEDVAVVFNAANNNGLSVSDVDADPGALAVTLQVTRGRLTLSSTAGLTFTDGDGTADASMTFSGTLTAINTALDGLVFTPPRNFSGRSTLQLVTNDQGNAGAGGAQSALDTVTITVTAVNDAPVNRVPGPQATTPGVALTFNAANNNLISISDVDAGTGLLEVTLSVTVGTLTLSGTAGLTFIVGDGTADATMTFSGTLTDINAALDGLVFTPPALFDGDSTLQLVTSDQGNTGSGGPQSDTDTVSLIVSAVNDPPVNTVPGAQTLSEGAVLVLSPATGNAISISDSDAGAGLLAVTLNVTAGTLSLSGTTGLTFTDGDGTADAMMTFSGTLVAINTALEGLVFTPPAGFTGTVTLQLTTNDQGNTGGGGPQTDTDTVTITVTAVNDAPVNTVPGAQSTPEDVALVFSTANGNALSTSDTDVLGGDLAVTLSVTTGTLSLGSTTDLTFTEGDGTADATMTFTGTLAAINTALEGLVFTPAPDFSGDVTLHMLTDDQGNTGSGGPQTDTDTVTITVTAVNDAPVNLVPGEQTTTEDTELAFTAANGNLLMVSDVDAGAGLLTVTLSVTRGLLTLSTTAGLTFTDGAGRNDRTMTFSGTLANINTALDGLLFTPPADFSGVSTVQLSTNDQGNTGAGGPLSDSDTVAITVTAVNDPPVNTVPFPQATPLNTPVVFTAANGNALRVSDVDVGAGLLEVILSVTNGTLTLGDLTDLTFTTGDGTADPTMTFTGTLAAINMALEGTVFTPPNGFRGDVTLQLTTSDQGNTGAGGPQSDTDSVLIAVGTRNEPPVNIVPGPQTTPEDVALVFNASNGNSISTSDPDIGTGPLEVTLSVTAGALTLSRTTDLTFTEGDGMADARMVFTGMLTAINAALDGLVFTPPPDFVGDSTLQITTNAQNFTGGGGAQSDTDTVLITVTAVNDPPVNSVPAAQTTREDVALVFTAANDNLVRISDVDAGPRPLVVTLSVTAGTLSLGSTVGLTFTEGDGIDDATMRFTGRLAAINTALDGLVFTPPPDFAGDSTFQITTNDQDNTGSGGPQTDTDTVTITVTAVNDAPVNRVPEAQTTPEDVALVFNAANNNGLRVSDVDADPGALAVTLQVTRGRLTLGSTAGLTFTDGDGTADASMTFSGTLTAINTALDGLVFTPPRDFSGRSTLQLVTNDQGNTGAGGAQSALDTVTITVTAVNDAPVNRVPGPQATTPGVALIFNAANNNLISITDVDAGTGLLEVTLSVTVGTLTLSGTAGLTFIVGDGTADASMTFSGTLAAINAALDGLVFTPPALFDGDSTLQLVTSDQGNTGSGGPQSATDTVSLIVSAVNDPPVNTVPGAQTLSEGAVLVFSPATGNTISISDSDAGSGLLAVTLHVTAGTLSLRGTTGLTFTESDGTADATMTFTGTLTAINTAFDGLVFTPPVGFTGTVTLQLTTNDQGNTGGGGPQTDTDTVTITVTAVNDAPVNTVPGAQSTPEDVALVFTTANGNQISIADVDVGAGRLEIVLSVTDGQLTLSGTAGLTFTDGDGTADATMTFTGTLTDINTALDGLVFTPPLHFVGEVTLQLVTDDQGNTGSGGPQTDTDTVTITVTAVNDAPVNTVPGAQSTPEDVVLVFNATNSNQLSITDVDVGAGVLHVTLSVNTGTLTLSGTTGLTFTDGDGMADATMAFTGAPADINTALDGLVFTPLPDFAGTVTLQLATDDQGNTGSGGPQTDTDTVTITVMAVNDAPINTVPGAQATVAGVALTFNAENNNLIRMRDVDSGLGMLEVTLSVTAGTLTLSGTADLSFTVGDGTAEATMTFTGMQVAINTALDGLVFTPLDLFDGDVTLQLVTDDQGNTGSGGPQQDTDTVIITVSATNEAPVNTVPGAQTTPEDVPLVFSAPTGNAISISDADAGSGLLAVTIGVTDGQLTLSGTAGLTFTTGDGSNDVTMTFTGTLAAINIALEGLIFTPPADFIGTNTLQLVTDDQGNTGSGGPQTDTDTVTITVTAVNDAPVNSVPGAQTTAEDVTLVFNTGNGNLLRISDVDAGTGVLEVTLSVTDGTLTLSGTAGLTFTVGSGTDEATMTFTGTLADLNAALDGLVFTPARNFTGDSLLQLVANDQGNTGAGGPLSDTDTVTITVTAVNDAPVLTAGATLAYTENQAATALDTTLTVSDVDTPTLAQVTVQITDNYQAGEDVLGFTDQLGITGTFAVATGALTLTGPASLGDFQTALRTVTYRNTSNTPTLALRTITWIADDGAAANNLSAPVTSTVTITPVNDAPVLTAGATLAYTENDAATAIDATITVSDLDTTTLASVTVQITGNHQPTEDRLGFTDQLGITGIFVVATGTLTLTGPAALADFATALRTVTYRNTADAPDPAPRTITWLADDGAAVNNLSAPVTGTITITPVNDAPVLTAGATLAYTENDAATAIDATVTVSDVDTATLASVTVQITGNHQAPEDRLGFTDQLGITGTFVVATGTLTLTGPAPLGDFQTALRTVTYRNTSEAPTPATRIITWLADDGETTNSQSTPVTSTITIAPVNDAPSFTTGPDQIVNEDAGPQSVADWATGIHDGDAGGTQTLTFNVTGNTNASLFSAGPAVSAAGTLTYTPATNANGMATITLTLSDDGGTANGGVDTSAPQTFTITVTAVNDAPSFTASDPLAVDEDAGVQSIPNWATFSPGPANESAQTVGGYTVSNVSNLVLFSTPPAVANNGTLTYTPAANANGTSTFDVVVQDDGGTANGGVDTSAVQTFTIIVNSINDAPVLTAGGTLAYTENAPATAIDPTSTVIDVDSAILTGATVQITGNYQNGEDVLSFVDTATITGIFTAATGLLTLTGTDTVANYQTALRSVSYRNTSESPATAARTITWIATDGTTPSLEVISTITVAAENDAPVLNASGTPSLPAIDQDAVGNPGVLVSALLATGAGGNPITDPDTGALEGIAVIAVDNTNGDWQYDPAGGTAWVAFGSALADTNATLLAATASIRFVPNSTFNGVIDPGITFRAWDQSSGANGDTGVDVSVNGGTTAFSTATETASITVDPVPQNATYDAVGNTELVVEGGADGTGAVGNAFTTAPDGVLATTPTLTVVDGTFDTMEGGRVTIDAQGRFTYTPQAGDAGVADSFTYTVGSGRTATVTINLAERVWYVQNNVSGAGTGTSTDPFQALQSAETASAAGDTIFVFLGDGTTANQNAGITMQANQRLLGHQDTTFTVGTATVETPSPGAQPALGHTTGPGVTVTNVTGVEIAGLDITGSDHGIAVSAAGALTIEIRDNTLTGGTGDGVNVVTSSAGAAVALSLHDNVLAATAVAGAGARLDGSAGGTLTITNFANNRVDGEITDGTGIIVTSAIFDAAPGGTLNPVNAGTTAIGTPTDRVGAVGMLLNGVSGDLVFGALDIFSNNTGLQATGTGAFTGADGFRLTTASGTTIDAEGGPALNLSALSLTNTLQGSVTSTNSPSTGISLNNVEGTITFTSSTITNPAGTAFNLTGGTVDGTYGGSITKNSAGLLVSVANHTMGTVTFQNGTLTATNGGGIQLSNVDGTVQFNGTTTLNGGNARVTIQGGSDGTITFGTNTTITNPNGDAFSVGGGTATITYNGGISKASAGRLVDVSSGYSGTLHFETGTLNATAGDGIRLDNANGTVQFNGPLTLNGGNARVAIQNGSGTFTFTNATITNPSDTAFSVAGGTASVMYNGGMTKSSAGPLVSVDGHATGTLQFQGTLEATNGDGIQLNNANGTVRFNGTTTLNGGGARVAMNGSAGTITFANTTIINPSGTAFSVSGGSPTVMYNGSITDTSDLAVSVASTTGGGVTLQGGTVTSSATGIAINGTAGTVTITDADLSGSATVSIANNTAAITFNDLQIDHSAGAADAIAISGGAGNVTINAANGIQSTVSRRLVNIMNRTGGTVTFSGGTLQGTGSSMGISISGATAANAVQFNSAVDLGLSGNRLTGGTALTVDNNGQAGAEVSFANLAVFTSGQIGIDASDGGTLNVTMGQINTLSSNATGLQLNGLTVGMTFSSVTVNTIGGSNEGLDFDNVSGSFTVTGTTTLNSTGIGIAITGGTGAMTFGQVDINNRGDVGIAIDGGGQTVQFGATIVNNQNADVTPAINVANRTGGTLSFDSAVVAMNNVAATGINLSSNAGTMTFGAGSSLTGLAGTALNLSGGTANVTYSGAITQGSNNTTVAVANHNSGTVTFNTGTIMATNGNGLQFTTATGAYQFTGPLTLNGGDAGIDILTNSTGTFTFGSAGTPAALISPSGTAFNVTTGAPTVTYNGNVTQNNAQRVINVDGTTGGSVTLQNGTVTGGASSTGVNINNANGNVSFATLNLGTSGSRMTNQAVTITGGTGTYSLGTVSIFTNNVQGLVATNANGALNSTSGTVNATNARAINIDGPGGLTTLGMTLTTVSSTNSTTNGMLIQDTDGGFTITGTGTAGSGGTIQSTTGADNASSTPVGTGIVLNNTRNVSLTRMQFNDHSNYAIRGSSVVDFTMDNTIINGTNGTNAATPFNEGSVRFTELTGSAAVTNCNISGAVGNNFAVTNTAGTLNRITVTGTTFGPMSATAGESALLIESLNNAIINTTVQNSTFTAARSNHIARIVNSSSASDTVITGNTISNTGVTPVSGGGAAIRVVGGSNVGGINASATFNVSNNTMRDSLGTALAVNKLGGSGTFSGTIANNTVGVPGVSNSGSEQGSGIFVLTDGPGSYTASITGNTVHQYGNFGVFMQTGGSGVVGSGDMRITVTGNTVANPGALVFAKNGVQLNGGVSPGDTYRICLTLGGAGALANAITGTGTDGGTDFRLRQRQSTTVYLPGYGGANNNDAAVVSFAQGNNDPVTIPTGSATNTVPTGGGFQGVCPF